MKRMVIAFYAKPLSIYLGIALLALSTFATPAGAMFLPSAPQVPADQTSGRSADLGAIQRTLESRELQQQLVDYGLSPGEAMSKLSGLSDEQVHRLASNMSALQAGGRGGDISTTTVLLILLVVLLILLLVQDGTGPQTNVA